ncbi:MAG: histidine phosphatase family protein [Lentisphaerota bacterium]
MLKLFLLRHAKSSWDDVALNDFDRPLNKRGVKDAPLMGKYFSKDYNKPQLIISSPARRARETAELFAESIDYKIDKILFDKHIYEATLEDLVSIVLKIEDSYEKVMIVGHNPAFTELANYLAEKATIDNIPTCGIFALEFKVKSWRKIDRKSGALLSFDYPKNH